MDTPMQNTSHIDRLVRLFCLLLLVGIGLFVFGPAGDDDGHITYTAAKNFADNWQVTADPDGRLTDNGGGNYGLSMAPAADRSPVGRWG